MSQGQIINRSTDKKGRGPKAYLLRWEAGRDGSGKRMRKSETFHGTRDQAEARLREILQEIDKGTYVEPTKLPLREWSGQWLNRMRAMVSERTLETYSHYLTNHVCRVLGETPLQKLHRARINTFYSELVAPSDGSKGRSPQTVKHIHRILSECLKHAQEDGLIAINPTIGARVPRVLRRNYKVLSEDQLAAFLASLDPAERAEQKEKAKRWRMTDANREFLHGLCTVAALTGARRGELLALRWCDVDMQTGILTIGRATEQTKQFGVRVKLPKTNRTRQIGIPPGLCAMLADMKRRQKEQWLLLGVRPAKEEEALLFPAGPDRPDEICKPNLATQRFKAYAKSAGLEGFRFHDIRHTHASQLLSLKFSAVETAHRLGHTSPNTTMAIYAHIIEGTQARMTEEVGRIFAKVPSRSN